MEAKLIAALALVCALCHVTRADLPTATALQRNITQTGCGSWKTCIRSAPGCDPSGNSSCFFGSVTLNNQSAAFELSGTTSGYVALGIQSQSVTVLFVCGNNNGSFFFNAATLNATTATPANVSVVYSVQGAATQSLVQCAFNTSTVLNISTSGGVFAVNIATSNITVINGTTNGTKLGSAAVISPAVTAVSPTNIPVNTMNTTAIPGSTSNITANSWSTSNSTVNITASSWSSWNSTVNITASSWSTSNSTVNITASSWSTSNSTVNITTSPANTTNKPSLGVSRSGCGSSKLCFSNKPSCNPSDSGCFFASAKMANQTLLFELSGSTIGYVALGLSKQDSNYVFICGNNTNNNSFFFQTATRNGAVLTAANVNTVFAYQGQLANASVQCVFNTSTVLFLSTRSNDTSFNATLLTGTTDGTKLGNSTELYSTTSTIDLSDPTALTTSTTQSPSTTSGSNSSSAISVWTHVCVMLLSVMSLHFVTSHSP